MKGKTIVLASSVDDVVIVTPRTVGRARGVIGRELYVAASALDLDSGYMALMDAVLPCFATTTEPHVSGGDR